VISRVKPENIIWLREKDGEIVAEHPQASSGQSVNQIMENIQGTPGMDPDAEREINYVFTLIERKELEQAKQKLQEWRERYDNYTSPLILKAELLIARKEAIGK